MASGGSGTASRTRFREFPETGPEVVRNGFPDPFPGIPGKWSGMASGGSGTASGDRFREFPESGPEHPPGDISVRKRSDRVRNDIPGQILEMSPGGHSGRNRRPPVRNFLICRDVSGSGQTWPYLQIFPGGPPCVDISGCRQSSPGNLLVAKFRLSFGSCMSRHGHVWKFEAHYLCRYDK